MVAYLVIASTLLAAPAQVKVEILGEPPQSGQLIELGRDGAALETSEGRVTIPADKLVSVAASRPSPSGGKATGTVELVDGSTLAIVDYRARGGMAHITLAGGVEVDLATRAIRWVRFQPTTQQSDKLAKQWAAVLDSKPAGDLIVVRKKGSLDYLEGRAGDVDEAASQFFVDGDILKVPRTTIEGLVYFHAKEPDLAEPVCKAVDVRRTTLFASEIALDGGQLKISTPAGLKLAWPVETCSVLDFSTGKIQYLSDLEPESVQYVPYFGLSKELVSLSQYYAPRRDVGFDQSPLKLDGKQYSKGLALSSRTTIRFRLPGKFRLFRAVAGIDDSVREEGNVAAQIKGDGKMLWEAVVKGTEKGVPLELNVEGVKRLEIVVDYGDDLDVADRFDLCEARVTK